MQIFKFSILIIFLMTVTQSFSQIQKRDFQININYIGSENFDKYSQKGIGIAYAFKNNWTIGLQVSTSEFKYYDGKAEALGGSLFFRRYYLITNAIAVYAQGGFNYNSADYTLFQDTANFKSMQVYLQPGMAVMVGKHFSIELGIKGLLFERSEERLNTHFYDDYYGSTNFFGISMPTVVDANKIDRYFNLALSIGVRYHFKVNKREPE